MIALDRLEAKAKYEANVAAFWQECQELSEYLEDCNPPEKRAEYENCLQCLTPGRVVLHCEAGIRYG